MTISAHPLLAISLSVLCAICLSGCQPLEGSTEADQRSSYNATITDLPPLKAPIQLRFRPFKEVRYRSVIVRTPDDPNPLTFSYAISGVQRGDNLLLTVRSVNENGFLSNPGQTGYYQVLISADGRILNDRALQSDPTYPALMYGMLEPVLPIYTDHAVGSGELAARTTTFVSPNGESYDTLILRGEMNVSGKRGLWLDFERTIFTKKRSPGILDSYPRQGHMIVDPTNGMALQYRWIGANGGSKSADRL